MNSNPSEPGRTSPQLPAPFPCQWWVWPVTGGHAWPCTDVPFPRGWEVSWVPTRGSARPPADTSWSDTAYCYPKPWGSAPPLCYWQPQTPPAEQSLPPFLAQAPTSGSWQRGCSFPAKRSQSCERLPSSPRAFLTEQAQSRTSVLWQEILHSLLPRLAGRLPAYSSARLRRPGCRPRGDTALLRHHHCSVTKTVRSDHQLLGTTIQPRSDNDWSPVRPAPEACLTYPYSLLIFTHVAFPFPWIQLQTERPTWRNRKAAGTGAHLQKCH